MARTVDEMKSESPVWALEHCWAHVAAGVEQGRGMGLLTEDQKVVGCAFCPPPPRPSLWRRLIAWATSSTDGGQ